MKSVFAALVPPDVVTSTDAVPAVPVGTVALIEVELTTLKLVAAAPPMVTALAPVKFVPVMVIAVPPSVVPVDGETLVMVGAGVA